VAYKASKLDETGRLTAKQERAIIALISSPSVEEAAKAAGISKSTIFKWFQDEGFQSTYRAARGDLVRHAIAQAQAACSEAVAVLREIMNNVDTLASTRVSAAKTLLETSIKAVELEDIVARIEKLEEKTNLRR
jgi:hypothetical protein